MTNKIRNRSLIKSKGDRAGKSKNERENRRHLQGSENQPKKYELAQMGIEPMAFGLALRRSNH